MPRGHRRSNAAASILSGLVGASIVAAVWAVWAWRGSPEALRESTPASGQVGVTASDFSDSRDVTFDFTVRPGASLRVALGGVITSSACSPGQELTSGTRVVTVGDSSFVAVYTAVPLWRDLSVGSKGEDVNALVAELTRLGRLPAGPTSAPLTSRALRAALDLVQRKGNSLRAGDLLWIPAPRVSVGTCDAQVGSPLAPGGAVLTLTSNLERVRITSELQGLIPGERVARIMGLRVPVRAGRIESPEALDAISASDAFRSLMASATPTLSASSDMDVVVTGCGMGVGVGWVRRRAG